MLIIKSLFTDSGVAEWRLFAARHILFSFQSSAKNHLIRDSNKIMNNLAKKMSAQQVTRSRLWSVSCKWKHKHFISRVALGCSLPVKDFPAECRRRSGGTHRSLSAAAKQTLHSEMKGTSSELLKADIQMRLYSQCAHTLTMFKKTDIICAGLALYINVIQTEDEAMRKSNLHTKHDKKKTLYTVHQWWNCIMFTRHQSGCATAF